MAANISGGHINPVSPSRGPQIWCACGPDCNNAAGRLLPAPCSNLTGQDSVHHWREQPSHHTLAIAPGCCAHV